MLSERRPSSGTRGSWALLSRRRTTTEEAGAPGQGQDEGEGKRAPVGHWSGTSGCSSPRERAAIRGNVRISFVGTSRPQSRFPTFRQAVLPATVRGMQKATNEEVVRRYGAASAGFDI